VNKKKAENRDDMRDRREAKSRGEKRAEKEDQQS
jgi:hypothetical protein